MRLVYSERNSNRQASFEFLNRQMVWHAFTVSSIGDHPKSRAISGPLLTANILRINHLFGVV